MATLSYGDFAKYVKTLRSQCNIYTTESEQKAYDYALQSVLKFFEDDAFETRWIPCSERLPEEDENVIVTYKDGRMALAYYNGSYWTHSHYHSGARLKTVVAWMPMPKPYGGAKDGTVG